MLKWTMIVLLGFFIMTASAQGMGRDASEDPESISPEDLKVVAHMETLQLWELTEDQEMMEDMNLLIEEEENESQTK